MRISDNVDRFRKVDIGSGRRRRWPKGFAGTMEMTERSFFLVFFFFGDSQWPDGFDNPQLSALPTLSNLTTSYIPPSSCLTGSKLLGYLRQGPSAVPQHLSPY